MEEKKDTEMKWQIEKDENEEPSDKVTDGNTHSLTACRYHSTESANPLRFLFR